MCHNNYSRLSILVNKFVYLIFHYLFYKNLHCKYHKSKSDIVLILDLAVIRVCFGRQILINLFIEY